MEKIIPVVTEKREVEYQDTSTLIALLRVFELAAFRPSVSKFDWNITFRVIVFRSEENKTVANKDRKKLETVKLSQTGNWSDWKKALGHQVKYMERASGKI